MNQVETSHPISNIAWAKFLVVGAGTMGRGIAQWLTQANASVWIMDLNHELALKSQQQIMSDLTNLIQKGKIPSSTLTWATKNLQVLKYEEVHILREISPDYVIEAIIETIEAKKKLFNFLKPHVPSQTIFASNSSSLTLKNMAPDQKIGEPPFPLIALHFFNPATLMKLVEVGTPETLDPNTLAKTTLLIKHLEQNGKKTVKAKDSPGLIVNRIARSFYTEALHIASHILLPNNKDPSQINRDNLKDIVNENLKSFHWRPLLQSIDQSLLNAGFKLGPFQLMDLIGMDINGGVTQSLFLSLNKNPRMRPMALQEIMIELNALGKKNGLGFFVPENNASKLEHHNIQKENSLEWDIGRIWIVEDLLSVKDMQKMLDNNPKQAFLFEAGHLAPIPDFSAYKNCLGFFTAAYNSRFKALPTAPLEVYWTRPITKHLEENILKAAGNHWNNPGLRIVHLLASLNLFPHPRIISMIVNEALYAYEENLATIKDINLAMELGVNYPTGPFHFLKDIGPENIFLLLDSIYKKTNDARYCPHAWLQNKEKLNNIYQQMENA